MAADHQTASLTQAVELLERSVNYTLGILPLANTSAMGLPSPCAGWDLWALLRHLTDSFAALEEAAECAQVALPRTPPARSAASPGLVTELQSRACALLGDWTGPGSLREVAIGGARLATDLVAYTGAVEVAVHGWDIAETCGHPRPIPQHLAADLLELAQLLVTDIDRPVRFAAPRPVRPQAGPGERLIAFLGR
jgi:uncharacterized protein (TIGR03086 family)